MTRASPGWVGSLWATGCRSFAAEFANRNHASGRRAVVVLKSSFLERYHPGSVFVLLYNVMLWFEGWKRTSKRLYRGGNWETSKKVTMKVKMIGCFNNFSQERKEMFCLVCLIMCAALKNTGALLESEMSVPVVENSTLLRVSKSWKIVLFLFLFDWSGQILKVRGGRTWLQT